MGPVISGTAWIGDLEVHRLTVTYVSPAYSNARPLSTFTRNRVPFVKSGASCQRLEPSTSHRSSISARASTNSLCLHAVIHTMGPVQRCTKSPRIARGVVPSSERSRSHDPDKEGSGSVTTQGSRSRDPRKATLKRKWKQPEKLRNAGKLSKLPDMPLDVLYEVSYRTIPATDDGRDDDAPRVCRYSVLFTRWIYWECHGPTRPFVTFL